MQFHIIYQSKENQLIFKSSIYQNHSKHLFISSIESTCPLLKLQYTCKNKFSNDNKVLIFFFLEIKKAAGMNKSEAMCQDKS